jgi:hypothetical protein
MLTRESFVSSNDVMASNKLELPLLPDDCTSNSCDKLDIVSSNPVNCAKIRTLNPITNVYDDVKLLSFLNTLGYIQFDVLCNLNNLE